MFQKKASWWKEFDWVEGVLPHLRAPDAPVFLQAP
jgi:hypothetical protein